MSGVRSHRNRKHACIANNSSQLKLSIPKHSPQGISGPLRLACMVSSRLNYLDIVCSSLLSGRNHGKGRAWSPNGRETIPLTHGTKKKCLLAWPLSGLSSQRRRKSILPYFGCISQTPLYFLRLYLGSGVKSTKPQRKT